MLLSRSLCKNKKNIIRKSTNIHVSFSCSNIYYINDNLDKRTWTYIFGACCATTVFIPSFHNYRIWSFLGLLMTTFTAWYLTIASLTHGQVLDFFYNLCRSQKSEKKTQYPIKFNSWFFFLVSSYLFSTKFQGWRSKTLRSNQNDSVFHGCHQYSLHLWRTCCHSVWNFFLYQHCYVYTYMHKAQHVCALYISAVYFIFLVISFCVKSM